MANHGRSSFFVSGLLFLALAVGAGAPAFAEEEETKETCLAPLKMDDASVAEREADVPSSYKYKIEAGVGGFFAGGFDGSYGYEAGLPDEDPSTLGTGWSLRARGDVDLLHPIHLGAQFSLLNGGNRTAAQVDLIGGFSFRDYGNRWVDAGHEVVGGQVIQWDGHCQLRREDRILFGGIKTQFAFGAEKGEDDPTNWVALQGGYMNQFRTYRGTQTMWSVAALADPFNSAVGGTVHFSTGWPGLPKWFLLGVDTGLLVGDTSGGWFLFDLGMKYED